MLSPSETLIGCGLQFSMLLPRSFRFQPIQRLECGDLRDCISVSFSTRTSSQLAAVNGFGSTFIGGLALAGNF
jgi:hypothetical protein